MSEASGSARWSDWPWLAPPTLAGALLRLWGVERQVLAGDELHALQFAAEHPLGTILTHTDQEVDHCVPITALVRLALDAGLEPSELLLRTPVLLAGLVLVPVLALMVRSLVGARASCVFAWLLALSPMLVLYGRILRSYGPVVLLALAAVLAFHRWLSHGKRADALLYSFLAPLAAYFHLVSAVFVAAPLAYAVLGSRWRRGGPSLRAVAWLGAGTALVAAVLFAPIASSLVGFVQAKEGEGSWRWATAWSAFQLQAGVVAPGAAWIFLAACLVGAVRLARARPGLCAYLAFLAVVHLATLFLASPAKYSNVLVFGRYVLVLLPILLLFAACAFGSETARGAWRPVSTVLSSAFLALLFFSGPLTRWQYLHGSFAHHNRFLAFVNARFDAAPAGFESSAFYPRLAAKEEVRVLAEYPLDHRWSRCNSAFYGQRVHGKQVLAATDLALHQDARFRWRNSVPGDAASLLASRADVLVLHLDPGAEERPLAAEYDERSWREVAGRARSLRLDLLARWGRPSFEDDLIAVWDLRKVREAR